jgi:hypothetical protein
LTPLLGRGIDPREFQPVSHFEETGEISFDLRNQMISGSMNNEPKSILDSPEKMR